MQAAERDGIELRTVSGTNLPSLTTLRFPAAIFVAIFHVSGHLYTSTAVLALATTAYPSVTFFFILSGFVITWSWEPTTTRSFAWSRVGRIWPVHVTTWFGMTLTLVLTGHRIFALTSSNFLVGLFLLQSWAGNIQYGLAVNSPAWSLSCEMSFYLFLPLMLRHFPRRIRDPKRWVAGLLAYCGASALIVRALVFHFQGGHAAIAPEQWLYLFPPYRVAEFIFGIVLAKAMKSGWRPGGSMTLATSRVVIGLCIIALLDVALMKVTPYAVPLPQDVGNMFMMLPLGWFIASSAARDIDLQRVPGRFSLGNLALSFYLTGFIALYAVGDRLPSAQPLAQATGELLLLLGANLVLALLTRALIENPGRRAFRWLAQPRRMATRTTAPPASPTSDPQIKRQAA